jgi:hypothetical protein
MTRYIMISVALVAAVAVTSSAGPLVVSGTVRCDVSQNEAVTVSLVTWDAGATESTVIGKARAKSGGSFSIALPPSEAKTARNVAVVLEAAGCRPLVKPLRAGQSGIGMVTMPAMATTSESRHFAVRGTVELPNGQPAAGAAVRLMALEFDEFAMSPFTFKLQPSGDAATVALTDAAGRFELFLNAPPPDPKEEALGLHLFIKRDGYPPVMLPVSPRQTAGYTVRLNPDAVHLRGVVVDSTEVPVEGADIYAASLHSDMTTVVATRTSSNGVFDLELPASDVGIRLAVNHRAFVPEELQLSGRASLPASTTVRLTRGVEMTGRLIREEDEGPVSSGTVKAVVSDGMFWMTRTATSDADGFFALQGISPAKPSYSVAAEAKGFLSVHTDSQAISEPKSPFVFRPIALRKSMSWAIDVVDPSGNSVADAVVAVMEDLYGPTLQISRTNKAGNATFDVAAGAYVLRVSTASYPARYTPFEVAKPRRDRIQLNDNATIRGRVVWSDQTPAAGVEVRCLPAALDPENAGSFQILPDQRVVQTDADGAFSFERLAPGPYLLHLNASESVDRRVDPTAWPEHVIVEPGALVEVDGVLPKPSMIELVLEGAPIPSSLQATLTEVNSKDEVINEFEPMQLEVSEGKAFIEDFVPGRYNLEIRLNAEATVDPQVVEVGAVRTSVTLKIKPGQKVRGNVLSDQGLPLAGAAVSLWLDRGNEVSFGAPDGDLTSEELITDEHGRFATGVLRSGQYAALVMMDGFAPTLATFEVDANREPALQTVTLRRGFPLQVDVRGSAGSHVAEFIATLVRAEPLPGGRSFEGIQQECERIPTGCRFEYVTPGLYVLRVVRDEKSQEFPIRVASQTALSVTLSGDTQ